ncbi:hypothetical protein [Gloeobacter kilaueensis]|uniref:Uncharacterized protein n=1 Tax=Gloeobacter kilaueensis (strain ATCC BAA-2537 / CCAP 1431/1 / ULC 316 / JS1) TaxID=1183438 RepID=U5QM22_GLOK1|nr:hypothetical protein [Gloeobacter kilaueensis]AGY59961.1 hypothetical protein GKIL_3715 [Gloeobacter kilaueensis JS1]
MDYRGWKILIRREWNGIAADCVSPEGLMHTSPFCFQTEDQAAADARSFIEGQIRQAELLAAQVG